ncbi:MAG: PAS domain S-box protein, partial [Candidatus Omnitrophica bacterium]|nr:PAS domain S-box protein [Candidatus Omnitrophota bacterium]
MKEKVRLPGGINLRSGIWLMLALCLSGALFAWRTVAWADRQMRTELLRQARLVAQVTDVEELGTLAGTEADRNNPAYLRFKGRLAAVRSENPNYRFLYLMGRKADGSVFFFVDSEPAESAEASPPGQVYEEASEKLRGIFSGKPALVEGPFADRWGVWVSALVPIQSRAASIAVLGIDVDARSWSWDVAARAALPVGMMLVILIGIFSFVSTIRVEAAPKPVMRQLMLPLTAMVVVVAFGAGALLWQQYRQRMIDENRTYMQDISADLHTTLEQQAAALTMALQPIVADPEVQKALRQGDADRLLSTWRPVFDMLHRESGLTHFYFMDTQRVCLLRVHKPEKRGDRIERLTAKEAERTGQTAHGIELGPLGTFTLRVVQPVFEGGTLAGYVEMGKEIEDVLQALDSGSGNHIAAIIRKQYLDQKNWEDGMRLLGREANWGRLHSGAVIYSSQKALPGIFDQFAEQLAGGHVQGVADREVMLDGKSWMVFSAPLQDVSGLEVGNLLVMRDVTGKKAAFTRLLVLGGAVWAVLVALLLGFIYVLLRRTDAGIRAQEAALRASEESYRNQFAHNSVAMLLIDPRDGLIVDANSAAVAFYGYPRRKLLEMRITDINILPDEEVRRGLAAVMEGRGGLSSSQHRLADGTVREVEVASSRIQFGQRPILHSIIFDITERKRAEEALAESENWQRILLDNLPAGVLIVDPESRVIERVNSYVATMFGAPVDHLIGHRCHRLVCPAEEGACPVCDLGKSVDNSERLMLCSDGSQRPILKTVKRIRLNGREKLLECFVDLSERKRMEQELMEQHRLLVNVIEGTNVGTWRWNVQTGAAEFNERWAAMAGYTLAELGPVGLQTWRGLMHPEDLNRSEELLKRHFTGQLEYYDLECRIRHKSGDWLWVNIRGKVVERSSDGRPLVMTGTQADIQLRKATEEALRLSREQSELALQSARMGAWSFDLKRDRRSFDKVTCSLLGLDRATFLGTAEEFFRVVHPEDREALKVSLAWTREQGMPYEPEYRIILPSGEVRHICARGRLIKDDNGRPKLINGVIWDNTERREAEQSTEKLLYFLRKLLDTIPNPVFYKDAQGVYQITNKAFESYIGLPGGQIVGKTVRDISPGELAQEYEQMDRQLMDRPSVQTYESKVRYADGTLRDVIFNKASFRSFDGKMSGIIGVIFDITDRKLMENDLRDSKVRFDQIAALSREVIWEVDAEGRYAYVSQVATEVYGYSPDDLVGKKYLGDLYPNDGRDDGRKQAFQFFERREVLRDQVIRLCRKDGSVIWVSRNGVPLTGPAGEFVGYRGADNDITERRLEEETARFHAAEIERERQNLSTIFESAQVGLLLVDDEGRVRRINNVLAGMVGQDPQELVGFRPGEALGCVYAKESGQQCGEAEGCGHCAIRRLWMRVLQEGVVVESVEVKRNMSVNGENREMWCSINASPMDMDGARCVLFSIMDVTERKCMELSLLRAKESAEAADRAKGEFLANMSHEIRTPMNAILGFGHLLRKTTLNEKQLYYVNTVVSSGQLLLSIINDILDLTKISSGRMVLDHTPFNLNQVIMDAVRIIEPQIQAPDVQLVDHIDPAAA